MSKKEAKTGIDVAALIADKKLKGDLWVERALPAMVDINKEIKRLEEARAEESKPAKEILKSIADEYAPALTSLGALDTKLRERVMIEHEGSEAFLMEGVGELVFPLLWTFDVDDINKVDRKYLTINSTAVREDIKAGIRKIKGLTIRQNRSLQVRTKINGK